MDHLVENSQQYSISCLRLAIALGMVRSRPSMLDVAIVKQFVDIFVDKGSTIIAKDLMRNAKSINYMLTDEICNRWTGSFLQWDCLNPFCEVLRSY